MSSTFAPFTSEKTKADSIHASSLYYQYKPEWLPACPLIIHTLLHIPDQIRWMESCWTTWAFPIKRQCGYFQRSIQSRWNPYVSMDQHLIDLLQLQQNKILYNLTDEQLRKPPKYLSSQTKRLEDCKSYPGTFTLNLKIIYCRPIIRTCGSEVSGSPWWHHLQSPCEWLGDPVLCPAKGCQEISSRGCWVVGQTASPWRWGHHAHA